MLRNSDGLEVLWLANGCGQVLHLRRGELRDRGGPRAREGWAVGGAVLASQRHLPLTLAITLSVHRRRLSVLAVKNQGAEEFVGVPEIVKAHWSQFGRNFYSRYDYEDVDADKAAQVRVQLHHLLARLPLLTQLRPIAQLMEKLAAATGTEKGKSYGEFTIAEADVFSYTDPETGEVVDNQGKSQHHLPVPEPALTVRAAYW